MAPWRVQREMKPEMDHSLKNEITQCDIGISQNRRKAIGIEDRPVSRPILNRASDPVDGLF